MKQQAFQHVPSVYCDESLKISGSTATSAAM